MLVQHGGAAGGGLICVIFESGNANLSFSFNVLGGKGSVGSGNTIAGGGAGGDGSVAVFDCIARNYNSKGVIN